MRLHPAVAPIVVVVASIGAEARAQPPGEAGQISVDADVFRLALQVQSVAAASGPDPDSTTTIQIAPGADFFVAPRVSVGGQVSLSIIDFDDSDVTLFGIAPRVGFYLPAGQRLGFWPKMGVAYEHFSISPDGGGGSIGGYDLRAFLLAPILFVPADHFYLGAGPAFQTDLISKLEDRDAAKTTSYGLQSVVGGYW